MMVAFIGDHPPDKSPNRKSKKTVLPKGGTVFFYT